VSRPLSAQYRSGSSRDWIKVKTARRHPFWPLTAARLSGQCRYGRTTTPLPITWRADRVPGGYVVRDANGQALAYVYSRDNEAEARQAKMLTKDEARRIAINVAKLRSCWGRPSATNQVRGRSD
jgi:hypothetical protein